MDDIKLADETWSSSRGHVDRITSHEEVDREPLKETVRRRNNKQIITGECKDMGCGIEVKERMAFLKNYHLHSALERALHVGLLGRSIFRLGGVRVLGGNGASGGDRGTSRGGRREEAHWNDRGAPGTYTWLEHRTVSVTGKSNERNQLALCPATMLVRLRKH